jgi:hypothetical protein
VTVATTGSAALSGSAIAIAGLASMPTPIATGMTMRCNNRLVCVLRGAMTSATIGTNGLGAVR